MSYQTSIHFDPTALLIIKNEVDNSISQVETAVSTLAEDQALPFGIDDALLQLEQCAQVLNLIGMSNLAKTAEYSALLMRKIMGNPSEINTQDIIALSEGTNMLKRYIEFLTSHYEQPFCARMFFLAMLVRFVFHNQIIFEICCHSKKHPKQSTKIQIYQNQSYLCLYLFHFLVVYSR